jgi:glycosyltransferase involved in cell wall biosynthesis
MTVSILMSVYAGDKARYLEGALQSILDQTMKSYELVLVEDGDIGNDLKEVIDRFRSSITIKSVVLDQNMGLAKALNVGINHCKSILIARMDADDIMLPTRLEKQIKYLHKNPDVDILGSWAYDINADENQLSLRKVPAAHQDIIKYIWTCPLIHPSVMLKKQSLLDVGLYNENITRRQDYELWFRCAKAGLKFANIPEPLLLYRFTDAWFDKNNSSVLWQQVKMGWRGCRMLKLGPFAYIGTAFPLFKILLPKKAGMKLSGLIKRIDPRNR